MAVSRPVCIVLGGGGHARVIIDAIQASAAAEIYGVLDADRRRWGLDVLGARVLGGDDLIGELARRGVNAFAVGVGSVGDSSVRQRLFERACAAGLTPLQVAHPTAVRSRWAEVGPGCQLLAGSIVNAGATLGAGVIVNTGAIVEHDCTVGDFAHIATGARLASGVTVGKGAHVGVGASVRQSIVIGEGAVVGVAAGVVKPVDPHVTVGGVPARALRTTASSAPPEGGHY